MKRSQLNDPIHDATTPSMKEGKALRLAPTSLGEGWGFGKQKNPR
jgi:hypothetical protein